MSKLETRATNNEVDSPREEKSRVYSPSAFDAKEDDDQRGRERTKKKKRRTTGRKEKPWPQIFMRLVESL